MQLEFLLLSLVRINPRVSGYQLKSIINQSTGYFISVHLSQIYPALKKMYERGWVTFEVEEQVGKPSLKLYTITDAGVEALDAWLDEPFEFIPVRSNLDRYFVKLLCMGHCSDSRILAYIDTGIAAFTEIRDEWRQSALKTEKEYLAVPEEDIRDKYTMLWEGELSYMIDDVERRISQLKHLRKQLR